MNYRPKFHFAPQSGWCNDPNGLVFHDGLWHLFFQFHPHSLEWGPMHWGHAVSRDLVAWEEWPIALAPDELGTIYSGSASLADDGKIVACFTHHSENGEAQSLAFSGDGGRNFEKFAENGFCWLLSWCPARRTKRCFGSASSTGKDFRREASRKNSRLAPTITPPSVSTTRPTVAEF